MPRVILYKGSVAYDRINVFVEPKVSRYGSGRRYWPAGALEARSRVADLLLGPLHSVRRVDGHMKPHLPHRARMPGGEPSLGAS